MMSSIKQQSKLLALIKGAMGYYKDIILTNEEFNNVTINIRRRLSSDTAGLIIDYILDEKYEEAQILINKMK